MEHLFSAPFSPQVVQNSASMKPTWPVMAWVSTDRAVGSLPCNHVRRHESASKRDVNTGTLNLWWMIFFKRKTNALVTLLNLASSELDFKLTISTGAILRTSCCSRVASQYGNLRMHSLMNFSWNTGKPSASRPFSKLQIEDSRRFLQLQSCYQDQRRISESVHCILEF